MTGRALHRQLLALRSAPRAAILQRFFKTGPGEYGAGDRFLGITVPVLRRLARAHQALPLAGVGALLQSPWHEERLLALLILVRRYDRAAPSEREAIYRLYRRRRARINSWDLVDCSAEHIIGAHLRHADRSSLQALAGSRRVWDRRIAVMATFHYIKRGEYQVTLQIARLLLDDEHDLIHQAVGWMLREVGKRDQAVEEAFLRRTHTGCRGPCSDMPLSGFLRRCGAATSTGNPWSQPAKHSPGCERETSGSPRTRPAPTPS